MQSNQTLRLLVSSNAGYAYHIVELFKSIVAFNRSEIELFIIHDEKDNSPFDQALGQLSEYDKLTVQYLRVDQARRIEIEKRQDFVPLVLRIYLPDFKIQGRLIYLDLDTMVTGDITNLMNFPMDNKPIAAALDYLINLRLVTQKDYATTKLSPSLRGRDWAYKYINNGVMIIDCDVLNQEEYSSKWLNNLYKAYDNVMFEQDLINSVNRDDIVELPNAYNFLYSHMISSAQVANALGWDKIYQEQNFQPTSLPSILHFAGRLKQWHETNKRNKPNPSNELFKAITEKSFKQITAEPISFYHDLFTSWMEKYNYTYYMCDQFAGVKRLTREEIKNHLNNSKPTSYSPYLLDYKAVKIFNKAHGKYFIKKLLGLK